jgi:hypothetical protein
MPRHHLTVYPGLGTRQRWIKIHRVLSIQAEGSVMDAASGGPGNPDGAAAEPGNLDGTEPEPGTWTVRQRSRMAVRR